jgi:hypothetical protein
MSNPNAKPPANGVKFKKGQSGNPLGGKLHNKDLKAIRHMTQDDVAKVGQLIVEGDVETLKIISEDPTSTVLQVWMAKVALRAILEGNAAPLDTLLNRIVGKPKDQLHLTGELSSVSDEELIKRAKQLAIMLKDK